MGKSALGRREDLDRLSTLADDILIYILSFLPLKSAIVTSVLSNRYRNLWPQITSIDIDFYGIQKPEINNRSIIIVDEAFKQLTSTSFFRFRLSICDLFPSNYTNIRRKQCLIDSWFQQICAKNVKEIMVRSQYCFSQTSRLPQCVYQTKSLVVLELDKCISLGLNCDDITFNLPNLKKLKIHQVMYRLQWLEKLVNSCPSLEDLHVQIDRTIELILLSVVNLSGRNSKRLVLLLYGIPHTCTVIIDSPNLEHFTVTVPNYDMLKVFFRETPAKLVKQEVR